MTTTRSLRITGIVVAAGVLVAVFFTMIWQSPSAHSETGIWKPLTPGAEAAGVRFEPALNPDASIPADRATSLATARVGSAASLPGVSTRVALGNFSDDSYFDELADGTRAYKAQDRLAWVVTFSGTHLQPRGRSSTVNTEINVAVDALTGEIIEVFSYR